MTNTAANTVDPETAVRQYLLYLEDPAKLRDDAEVEKWSTAVGSATDPIEKLKALAELERVSKVDEAPLREGFMRHAKSWADAQGVPISAFRELKVPDEVLREAGFEVPAGRRRARGAASVEGRQRAKAVPIGDIKAWILDQKSTFLLADVMREAGGSPATVRKAVDELIEAGQVERLGPVPDWQGRGRAPVRYSRS